MHKCITTCVVVNEEDLPDNFCPWLVVIEICDHFSRTLTCDVQFKRMPKIAQVGHHCHLPTPDRPMYLHGYLMRYWSSGAKRILLIHHRTILYRRRKDISWRTSPLSNCCLARYWRLLAHLAHDDRRFRSLLLRIGLASVFWFLASLHCFPLPSFCTEFTVHKINLPQFLEKVNSLLITTPWTATCQDGEHVRGEF